MRHFSELTGSDLPQHEWKVASITDRQETKRRQSTAESETQSRMASPALSPLPSLLSISAPVSQPGGRDDNGSALIPFHPRGRSVGQ